MVKEFNSLSALMDAFREPQSAIDHFAAMRWRNGRFCPYCKGEKIYDLPSVKNRFMCADRKCGLKFSITVGTIFENTKLPLRVWFGAMWLITNHKKGIASTTLARDLNITQKSAWFVLHRLRYAARTKSFNAPLEGTVEIDESHFGGKTSHKRSKGSKSSGPKGKTLVIGAVERGGNLVAKVLKHGHKPEVHSFINENISQDATLISDKHSYYESLEDYPNQKTHYSGVRTSEEHTNTIDGVWSLLKRQINGIHHFVSPKHLDQYVSEMTWRYNRRGMTAAERVNPMFTELEGRLTYRALIA